MFTVSKQHLIISLGFASQGMNRFIKSLLRCILIFALMYFVAFLLVFSGRSIALSLSFKVEPEDGTKVKPPVETLDEEDYSSLDKKEQQLLRRLEYNSNLPMQYWSNVSSQISSSANCTKFPSPFSLNFNNVYWQKLEIKTTNFYFYNAYFDNRPQAGNLPQIRIMTMGDKIITPNAFCQLWYDTPEGKNNYIYSKVSYTNLWSKTQGNYADGFLQPFILSCPVPSDIINSIPKSVSVVARKCDKPTNNLRIVNNRPAKKQDFAVCVKALDFLYEDISLRLVEWIELLNILGATKIFLYVLEVHPNISKVISYYERRGLVDVIPISLPGNQPNLPGFRHLYLKSKFIHKRQNEIIPYNDCLYRNLYSFHHIVPLDVDEIIMPRKHRYWKDLLMEIDRLSLVEQNYTSSYYEFRNVYFFDDVVHNRKSNYQSCEDYTPKNHHMLRHIYRSKLYTKPHEYVKSFQKVDHVLSVSNHRPSKCFEECTLYSVNPIVAHLQHYRKNCVRELQGVCGKYKSRIVRDVSILKYKCELISRVTKSVQDINFLVPKNEMNADVDD